MLRNIRSTWPSTLSLSPDWIRNEQKVEHALQSEVEAAKQQRLDNGKRNMMRGGRAAAKWLNGHTSVASPSLLYDKGRQSVATRGVNDSLHQLESFWSSIWFRQNKIDEEFALQQWCRQGHHSPLDVVDITPQDLWQAASRTAGSSAGPNGWSGDEVSAWPRRTWGRYATVAVGSFVKFGLKLGNMVDRSIFPKTFPPRVVLCMCQTCAQCVQSVLWRVVASSITRQANILRWLQQILPLESHGGNPGRGIDTALSSLEDAFHRKKGILVTLDYSKCFDMVSPSLALKCLEAVGFPPVWCQMLAHVCIQQFAALDSFSPMALKILLPAALRDFCVQEQHVGLSQAVFLDDRTYVAVNAAQARRVYLNCAWWSNLRLPLVSAINTLNW